MRGSYKKIAVALTTVLQAGVSAVVPPLLCIFAARYLMNRFALPPFTMLIAIVLGVLSGFYSMIKYIMSAINSTNGE